MVIIFVKHFYTKNIPKIEKHIVTEKAGQTYYNNRVVNRMKLLIIQADNRQVYMTQLLEEKGFDCTVFNPNLPSSDNERQFDGVIFALPNLANKMP